jgi:hypothetical protein
MNRCVCFLPQRQPSLVKGDERDESQNPNFGFTLSVSVDSWTDLPPPSPPSSSSSELEEEDDGGGDE